MLNTVLMFLQSQPKVKSAVEGLTGQPLEYVANCVGGFLQQLGKGPGLQKTPQQKQETFFRLYQGGLAMGFLDWESELSAAVLAGYQPIDVCISFQTRRKWPDTTIERINALAEDIVPRFVEAGKRSGLIPPEAFPDNSIPQTEISSVGGAAPWEQDGRKKGASVSPEKK